jgi:CheY-like chemotaxis protein/HPt (histidine-containing phosphotransfer) domain-containing protein
VQTVDNGHAAVEAASNGSYDIILMDCQMPLMDGFEASLEIRARKIRRRRDGGRVPVIALTANAMAGDRERCLAAGMDDFLSKPFKQSHLRALLERWLGGEQQRSGHEIPTTDPAFPDPALPDPVLDVKALDDLRMLQRPGKPDVVGKVIDCYLLDAPRLLAEMDIATETGDAAMLFKTAHRLKSSSANLGALQLAALCKRIEALGRQKTASGASGLTAQAHAVYAEVARHLKSYQARSAA